jgi:hypothetical protein
LPALHTTQLQDLLTGTETVPTKEITTMVDDKPVKQINPTYAAWVAREIKPSSATREALLHVSRCTTSAEAWKTLDALYSSHTRAHSVNMHIALATTKNHHMSISDYYAKMSQFANDLVAFGTPLHDDEFVAYLLVGLDEKYNPVFTAVVAWVDPISPTDLYAQLLSFEQHTTLQAASILVSPLPRIRRRPVAGVLPLAVPLEALLAAEGTVVAGSLMAAELDVGLVPHPGHIAKFA